MNDVRLERFTWNEEDIVWPEQTTDAFDPDQPRHPKGHPLGGQWVGTGSELIVRPEGWEASSDDIRAITRPGHFYRGMTEEEFNATVGAGEGVKSRNDFSASIEGTNFSNEIETAESYANSGSWDPRKTGKTTYIVEVKSHHEITPKPDGYFHAKAVVPQENVTRVWKTYAKNGAVVAQEIRRFHKDAFDPSQPRDPKGTATGGQWTSTTLPALRNVKPPSEDADEVLDASFEFGVRIGNETVPSDQINQILSQGDDPDRIALLMEQFKSPDGYFSRPIIDDMGDVLEGQHRVTAMKRLGVSEIPVYRVKDLARGMPIDAMRAAAREAGMRGDQVHSILKNSLEMIHEAGGVDKVFAEFDLPSSHEMQYRAVLRAAGAT